MAAARRVLIYGGKGALGSACVSTFKTKNYWVGSIDFAPNEIADVNIVVAPSVSWGEQNEEVNRHVKEILGEDKVDAILCVAGGWAGGNAASEHFIESADNMWKQSVWTSVIASSLAAKYLKNGGVLTLPGAQAALNVTPGMVGYGLAKAAVHQLTKSLAGSNSGMPQDSTALAILPVTLDTPMNRKWMPKADTLTWTPLEFVAELFAKWSENKDRPPSGSLVQLITSEGKTELIIS